jgi:hypothetical protein
MANRESLNVVTEADFLKALENVSRGIARAAAWCHAFN